jgi:phospholipid-binding lipoprotein MlaA
MSRFPLSCLLAALLLAPLGSVGAQTVPAVPTTTASDADARDAEAVEAGATEAAAPPTATGAAQQTPPQSEPQTESQSASRPAGEAGSEPTAPTQAELDYAALYGDAQYDPVSDPTLPAPAQIPGSYDPWEPLNRRLHAFNNVVDRRIAKPLAQAYVAVVPRPLRLGVGNFFSNLGQPVSSVNALLQGKPKQAAQSLARFAVNATLGLGGLFDPATKFRIPNKSEDFGQTLGVWGWKKSRYLELPLFGPRTVRDVFGLMGDAPLSLIRGIEEDKVRVFTQGLQLVDVRTQLMAVDSMREGAADEYALFRDAWTQRRNYQINGDRKTEGNDELPDYLREDQDDPIVPVDAMPIMPIDGG